MNTINSYQSTVSMYTQSSTQASGVQGQGRPHHHHHKSQGQDSVQFSQQGMQALNNAQGASDTKGTNPLDSLVSAGTITKDQETAIQSAFESARQSQQTSQAGASGSKPVNPLDSLVSAGTITKDQASAVQNSFESAMKAHHHHHHQGQQAGASDTKASDTLDNLVKTGTITQDQEKAIQNTFQTARKAYEASQLNSNMSTLTNPSGIGT